MNAAFSNSLAASVDANTLKLTITGTSSFYFNWSATTGNDCATQLGFYSKTDSGAAATSITSPNKVNLTQTLGLYVNVQQAENTVITSNTSGSAYGNLYFPLTEPVNSLMVYNEANSHRQKLCFKKDTYTLNITVYTTEGRQVSLNNANFQLLLKRIE